MSIFNEWIQAARQPLGHRPSAHFNYQVRPDIKVMITGQVNESLRQLESIWTCEQGAGEIWYDQSVIGGLDTCLEASEAWGQKVELHGKKKPRVLSSRP